MKKYTAISYMVLLIHLPLAFASAPAGQSTTIFSHGLGGNKDQGAYYHTLYGQPNAFIDGKMESFDYQDVQDSRSSCIGQDADIESLHGTSKNHSKVKLVGVSRGAAAIFNYLAKHQPKNVDITVTESPFDQVSSVVAQKAYFASFESSLSLMFPNYDRKGAQPIKSASSINTTIPMLLVCSQEDALIPASSTIKLYEALRKNGHERAHLLVTKHGQHANILNGEDGAIYRNVVHAFYKAYAKPHNPEWAAAGQARFASCQPEVTEEQEQSSLSSFFGSFSSSRK